MPAATLPTPPSSPPAHQHQSSSFALQKYLLLHSQHQELRQHLDDVRATAAYPSSQPTTVSATSLSSSPSVSPTRISCSPFGQMPSTRNHRRSSVQGPPKVRRDSPSLPPLIDESVLFEVAEEERRLFDVNEGMKRALTELLNGDQARDDGSFRLWVQCRLMETEKELRSERRRRSAP